MHGDRFGHSFILWHQPGIRVRTSAGLLSWSAREACLAVAREAREQIVRVKRLPVRLRPSGYGATAFARFALERLGLACPAVAREASEGWWGRQDSNLRSHKTADLQSAPFATRDTPPSQQRQQFVRPRWRRTEPSIWRWARGSVTKRGRARLWVSGPAKSTKGSGQNGTQTAGNCQNPEPVTQAFS
jgi:hypothetical protein